MKDGSPTRLPKVSTGKDGAPARRTGRGVDLGVGEKHASLGKLVEVGSLGDVVDSARSLDLGIERCLPAPVIGKGKQNVRSLG